MGAYIDYTGTRFGSLIVIGNEKGNRNGKRCMRICKCDCGKVVLRTDKSLKTRKRISCGCHLKSETKICSRCKLKLPKSEFHKHTKKNIGVQSRCKKCTAEYRKEMYWSNREDYLEKLAKLRRKPINVARRKEYYKENIDAFKIRYEKMISDPIKKDKKQRVNKQYRLSERGKKKSREQKAEYRKRPEVIKKNRERHLELKNSDLNYVIKRRLRNRLRQAAKKLANGTRYKSSLFLLGCDLNFFKSYLESTFENGMSWENISLWHIDHIKPCALFDLTKYEEQIKCFHYSNLQAMWGEDNIRKGAKYANSINNPS